MLRTGNPLSISRAAARCLAHPLLNTSFLLCLLPFVYSSFSVNMIVQCVAVLGGPLKRPPAIPVLELPFRSKCLPRALGSMGS